MTTSKVFIVILNYLQWQDTKDCLASVLRSAYKNYSVIVIDNNSQNDSIEHLIEWLKNTGTPENNYEVYKKGSLGEIDWQNTRPITFIQNDTNAGFAGGNNLVLRSLAGLDAYVWLLNPDMVIQDDTLNELVCFADGQTSNSIIGAAVRSYSGNREPFFYGGGSVKFLSGTIRLINKPAAIDKLDYISGGCLFTKAGNFKKWELLPEDYFLYWEETDWCYRAKQHGASLLVCQSAICYDKVSTVIGKGFLANYYYCRNGLLFIARFRKKNISITLFLMFIRLLKRIITGQWGKAGDYAGEQLIF